MLTVASSNSSNLALSGLASGIDWTSIINELTTIERAPEIQMKSQQTTLQAQTTAYQTLGSDLSALTSDIATLMAPSFFDNRLTKVSNSLVGSATADSGAPLGNFTFNVTQMATDAVWQGATAGVKPLSATADVSGVSISSAGLPNPITSGSFTVNGQVITVAKTDTLQNIFDNINIATNGDVVATYDPATDEITLTGDNPIVLGSATDTSNFLQAAKLYNNTTGTITSASALGGINLNNAVGSANLATTVDDGGSGAGQFLINGVAISFNAATDSTNTILARINNSAAGVTATYDVVNGDFKLTNKTTGDVGVSVQDVTGNFLAATGLSGGTLQHGTNLQYSVNGGGTITSQSNTINSTSSGVVGLSVTALDLGSTTVNIGSDTTKIADAITAFANDYNAVQNFIKSQTSNTKDANGNTVPGTLSGDIQIENIGFQLRQLANATPPGLAGIVQNLDDLGVTSNGSDNTLSVNPILLNASLATNLGNLKQMFTDPTNGLAVSLNTFLKNVNGSSGIIATKEANAAKETTDLTTSINNLETKIGLDQSRLSAEFTQMERAINTFNAQKQYLTAFFNSATTSGTGPTKANNSSSSSGG